MPQRAQSSVDTGAPFGWFTADEACGQTKWLQAWLEERDIWRGPPLQYR